MYKIVQVHFLIQVHLDSVSSSKWNQIGGPKSHQFPKTTDVCFICVL